MKLICLFSISLLFASNLAFAKDKFDESFIFDNFKTACFKFQGDMAKVREYMLGLGAIEVEQYNGEIDFLLPHGADNKNHKITVDGKKCVLNVSVYPETHPKQSLSVYSLKNKLVKKLKMKPMQVNKNVVMDVYALKYGNIFKSERYMVTFDGLMTGGKMRVTSVSKTNIDEAAKQTNTTGPKWP